MSVLNKKTISTSLLVISWLLAAGYVYAALTDDATPWAWRWAQTIPLVLVLANVSVFVWIWSRHSDHQS